jgi:hypothetical protein
LGVVTVSRKHDYAVSIGDVHHSRTAYCWWDNSTYMTRPALIEVATKRVLDIRQLFEDTFR